MLLGPRLIPKLTVWDSFQNLRWKLCQMTHQIPFVFLWPSGPMILVTEEPQPLKLGLNSKGFPHCPDMAYMVTSQCILWEHYHWQYKGGGAITEASHSYSHQQINFIRRLPAFANVTYYDLTVVNTYPYILLVHPAKHATDAATIQNLTETLLIPFRFPDNINIE